MSKPNLVFHPAAWNDLMYWLQHDRHLLNRIDQLIQDAMRNGYHGIGKPEPLKGNLAGWWSRRIDSGHRLVYRIKDHNIEILSCRGHYD